MATEMVTACSDVIAYFNVNIHSFPKLVFFIRKLEVRAVEQYGSFFEAVCIVVMHLFISFAQKKT